MRADVLVVGIAPAPGVDPAEATDLASFLADIPCTSAYQGDDDKQSGARAKTVRR
jgi:hypothetical protein